MTFIGVLAGLGLLALGALVGPVLGVAASLLAVQHAEVGGASTLTQVTKSHTLRADIIFYYNGPVGDNQKTCITPSEDTHLHLESAR